jgi:hypothetical protein
MKNTNREVKNIIKVVRKCMPVWDAYIVQTAEMKYLRRTARYTLLDHERNEEILEELRVTPVEKTLYIQTQLLPTRS